MSSLPTITPIVPTLVREPFHRDGWVYEEKYDGWRMIVYKDGSAVRLVSRSNVDHTARFRELANAIVALKAPTLILDGEVCVFDKDLVSQFHLLDGSDSDEERTPPVFMAFDCLHVHGLDVRGLPLHRRRAMLEQEVADARMIYAARRLPDVVAEVSYGELMQGRMRDPVLRSVQVIAHQRARSDTND